MNMNILEACDALENLSIGIIERLNWIREQMRGNGEAVDLDKTPIDETAHRLPRRQNLTSTGLGELLSFTDNQLSSITRNFSEIHNDVSLNRTRTINKPSNHTKALVPTDQADSRPINTEPSHPELGMNSEPVRQASKISDPINRSTPFASASSIMSVIQPTTRLSRIENSHHLNKIGTFTAFNSIKDNKQNHKTQLEKIKEAKSSSSLSRKNSRSPAIFGGDRSRVLTGSVEPDEKRSKSISKEIDNNNNALQTVPNNSIVSSANKSTLIPTDQTGTKKPEKPADQTAEKAEKKENKANFSQISSITFDLNSLPFTSLSVNISTMSDFNLANNIKCKLYIYDYEKKKFIGKGDGELKFKKLNNQRVVIYITIKRREALIVFRRHVIKLDRRFRCELKKKFYWVNNETTDYNSGANKSEIVLVHFFSQEDADLFEYLYRQGMECDERMVYEEMSFDMSFQNAKQHSLNSRLRVEHNDLVLKNFYEAELRWRRFKNWICTTCHASNRDYYEFCIACKTNKC